MIPVFIVIISVVLDQISKYIVSSNMEIGESFGLVKYILNITYWRNSGAVFGILKDHRWVFMIASIIAIIAMTAVLIYFIKNKSFMWMQAALALILGGGIGNMIDRLSQGYVVDFLEFDFVNFAIFNIADSCVTVGCVIFIIFMIIKRDVIFADTDAKLEETEKTDAVGKVDEIE